MLRDGPAGLLIDLKRAQDAARIAQRQPRRRLRVDRGKLRVQRLHALPPQALFQRLALSGRRERREAPPGDQAVCVQARAACQNDGFSARKNVLHAGVRHFDVAPHGKILVRLCDVQHVMPDALHFPGGRLGRADIHAAVELHGVAGNDLAVQPFGQLDGQPRLAGGRRADDTDDTVTGVHALRASFLPLCGLFQLLGLSNFPSLPNGRNAVRDKPGGQMRLNCFSNCFCVSVMQMGRPCGQYLRSSRVSTSRTSASRSRGWV